MALNKQVNITMSSVHLGHRVCGGSQTSFKLITPLD